MPLDFPSGPADGQVFAGWTYSAAAGAWKGGTVAGAQGPQGAAGVTGPQGPAGTGSQGPQGVAGTAGSAGPQGPQGVAGTGSQGPQGATGATGAQGSVGPQGAAGTGSQGPQGAAGVAGSAGPQGVQGATGAGVQGATGTQGPAGTAGAQGPQGVTGAGAQGPQGVAGVIGPQGPQGVTGAGAQGPQGPQGVAGSAGPQGTSGAQGTTGAQGPVGSTGVKGDPGVQGPQGDVGAGAQGPQGDVGPPGDTGPQGVQGAGAPGVQGVPGAQGPQGAQGGIGFGAQGPAGAVGPQGDTGSQGPAGVGGAQGPAGAGGAAGPQGPQGTVGLAGPQGPQGVQGAVGAGVQGAPGSQGPQGVAGAGVQGPQGAQGPSLFIIASTAPTLATTPVGAAWWDLDNGRTFICYDDGTSKQWVEFIGAPGVQGVQGAQGALGAGNPAAPANAIQYNNAGVFGGSVKLQYNGSQLLLDTTVGLAWGLTGYSAGISSVSLGTLEVNTGTKGQHGRLNLNNLYADAEIVGNALVSNTTVDVGSNLNFNGVGGRVYVHGTTGPMGDRTLFQTADANQNTVFGTLPSGTARIAAIQCYNQSDPNTTGSAYADLRISTTYAQITSASLGPAGTGTGAPAVLPFQFLIAGIPHVIGIDGSWSFNNGLINYDASGRVGVGTTPKVWAAGQTVIDIGPVGHLRSDGATCELGTNLYYDSGGWKYRTNGYGVLAYGTASGGNFGIYMAPSGTAGAVAPLTNKFNLDASGSISIAGNLTVPGAANVGGLVTGGATINSGASFGSTATTGVDLSKHIALYSTSYGLNVTSGTLNVIAGGVAHAFTASALTVPGLTTSGTITNYGQTNLTGLGCGNVVCSSINAQGNPILCGDITPSRSAAAGVVYLGSNQANFLYDDGTRFNFNALPLVSAGSLGVGMYQTTPGAPLHVHTAANANFVAIYNNAFPTIGYFNDTFSAWVNMSVQGQNAFWPQADNNLTCGGTSHRWNTVFAVAGTINTSDARLKKDIAPSTLGLSFIESLNPVSYKWIVERNVGSRVPDYEEEVPETTTIDGEVIPATTKTIYKDVLTPVPGTRTHWGLIAQDVKNAVTAAGVDFAGLHEGDAESPDMGLNYSEFVAPLVKAVQELSARVKALEAQLATKP